MTTAVTLNATINAASLRHVFRGRLGPALEVAFGVYAIEDRTVSAVSRRGFDAPPADEAALDALALVAAEQASRPRADRHALPKEEGLCEPPHNLARVGHRRNLRRELLHPRPIGRLGRQRLDPDAANLSLGLDPLSADPPDVRSSGGA